ncbi:MAG TPA: hypothetical protein VF013_05710 [Candidatus Limnocylindria bacterium]
MIQNTYTDPRLSRRFPDRNPARRFSQSQVRHNPWLAWRPERPHPPQVLSVADLEECRCPGLCNRDHGND